MVEYNHTVILDKMPRILTNSGGTIQCKGQYDIYTLNMEIWTKSSWNTCNYDIFSTIQTCTKRKHRNSMVLLNRHGGSTTAICEKLHNWWRIHKGFIKEQFTNVELNSSHRPKQTEITIRTRHRWKTRLIQRENSVLSSRLRHSIPITWTQSRPPRRKRT